MSIFYKHNEKELININELTRNQLIELYNKDYDEFLEFIDNLKINDRYNYIKILKLLSKDAYVYLNYCFINNDSNIQDKIFFEEFKTINNEELFENFLLNNDLEIIEYGMYFNNNNPLFKTRCFLELDEDENQKIIEFYPSHLLDLQNYVEDLNVDILIDYYHYLMDNGNDILLNDTMLAKDIFNFINYLHSKNQYLFEKIIGEIKNKIYKWNKYLLDNSNEDFSEIEFNFVDLFETTNNLELGEIALENHHILNEMIYQLFDYEIDKKEAIIDEEGNIVNITEEQVDEYIKKIKKKK